MNKSVLKHLSINSTNYSLPVLLTNLKTLYMRKKREKPMWDDTITAATCRRSPAQVGWMGSNQLFVECRWEKEFAARKQSRWHTMVIAGTSRTIVLMERRWSGENRFALSSLSLTKDPYKNGWNTSYCSYPYGEDWKHSKDPMMYLLFGR